MDDQDGGLEMEGGLEVRLRGRAATSQSFFRQEREVRIVGALPDVLVKIWLVWCWWWGI
jgi:hypothetical protein